MSNVLRGILSGTYCITCFFSVFIDTLAYFQNMSFFSGTPCIRFSSKPVHLGGHRPHARGDRGPAPQVRGPEALRRTEEDQAPDRVRAVLRTRNIFFLKKREKNKKK